MPLDLVHKIAKESIWIPKALGLVNNPLKQSFSPFLQLRPKQNLLYVKNYQKLICFKLNCSDNAVSFQ